MNAETGIVISFNNATGKGGGYGFIRRQNAPDIFVHIRDVIGARLATDRAELHRGDQVSFQIGEGKGGRPKAINVRVQLRANDAHEPPLHHTRD